jgi:catechol 2,3-dioxygenase
LSLSLKINFNEEEMANGLMDAPGAVLRQGKAKAPMSIAAVALAVRDLDAVAAFYRDVIGLSIIDQSHGFVSLGVDGTTLIELLHHPDALSDNPTTAGLYHVAFLLPSREDLARWLRHAGRLGYPLDGAADHLVSEAIYLTDPAGNGVEVYADRPDDQWKWEGAQVKIATLALDIDGLLREAGPLALPWHGAPANTCIGHVHLRVGDVAKAAEFYGDLGFVIVARRTQAIFMSTGRYHHHFGLNTWHSLGAGQRDPRMEGLAAVTIDVTGAQEAEALMMRFALSDQQEGELRDPWGTILRFRMNGTKGRKPSRMSD